MHALRSFEWRKGRTEGGRESVEEARITVSSGKGGLIPGSIAFSRANWDEKLVVGVKKVVG